jgi:hypothetical protein
MQSLKLAKACFEQTRQAIADPFFSKYGFRRGENLDVFEKACVEYLHAIWLEAEAHGRNSSGVQLLIDPVVHWRIPAIGKKILEITGDDLWFIRNRSDLVFGKPVRYFDACSTALGWHATSAQEQESTVSDICDFITSHVFPLLEDMKSIDDLIRLYEAEKPGFLIQRDSCVFVAAAYLVQGRSAEAASVMEKHLGRPGLRKIYASVFQYLNRMNK